MRPRDTGDEAVPILTYHSLDETGSVISVAPSLFKHHMDVLRDGGFQAVALGDLLDAWDGRSALHGRPVVLTFDDGFLSVKEHAAPLLQEQGFRGTIFVVAGYCGRRNDWPTQPQAIPRLPLCSWSDLRELSDAGFEVGAHGVTHTPLLGIAAEVERREVLDAKRGLEDHLGHAVGLFAYPYGVASHSAQELVRAHYRAACGVRMRAARPCDDRHSLARIDAYYLRSPSLLRLLGTPVGRAYVGLRALGRAGRSLLWPHAGWSQSA